MDKLDAAMRKFLKTLGLRNEAHVKAYIEQAHYYGDEALIERIEAALDTLDKESE